MVRSHRIQLDPTVRQAQYFIRACGAARFTYNWALAAWNDEYKQGGKPKANDLQKRFNALKYTQFPWLKEVHRDAHARPFTNLRAAWSHHFESLRKFKRGEIQRSQIVGCPVFKKKGKSADSFYVANDRFSVDGKAVRLPLIGLVRLTEPLRFTGKIQSAAVSREVDRWFISISVEVVPEPEAAPSGEPVGVDLGLTTFATLSTGEKVIAPKPLKRSLRKLRRLGRWVSRKNLKSANRHKAALELAKQHRRIKNIRRDFLHKFTTRLAKTHSEICIEDLHVKGMVKNHNLAFHISDAAWGETRRQLTYKTALYGSKLTIRDRFYASSKLCSCCGAKNETLLLSDRIWKCRNCGAVHDRDDNASKNLANNTAGHAGIYALEEVSAGLWVTTSETGFAEQGTLPSTPFGVQKNTVNTF